MACSRPPPCRADAMSVAVAVEELLGMTCPCSLTDARVSPDRRPTAPPHHRPLVRGPSALRREGPGRGGARLPADPRRQSRAPSYGRLPPPPSPPTPSPSRQSSQPSTSPPLSSWVAHAPSPSSPYVTSNPIVVSVSYSLVRDSGSRLLTSIQRTVVVYSRDVA